MKLYKSIMFSVCLLLSINLVHSQNQGLNNHWLFGYSSWGGLPFGNPRIDFFSGSPVVLFDSLEMEFNHTHSNISDTQGNLLFYTNGYYIADATHDTMMNGSGINPSSYTSYFSDGLGIPQANLILPLPDNNNLYYFIHSTVNQYPGYTCSANLYASVIDINQNGGLGAVIQKNQIILTDSMNYGKITATKHANGRDWWILCQRLHSNKFHMFLLTPQGLSAPTSQFIGNNDRRSGAGQAYFSPDGTKYAHYWIHFGLGIGILEIFDFDRCTGNLSNVVSVNLLPFNNGTQVGMSFSPNSELLYVFNMINVLQFDLTSANIPASIDTVATYDGFLSTYPGWPPLETLFCLGSLAPDGKIYITTGNSSFHLHTIDNPDVLGVGCNVNQHSVQLPAYYFNTLPNHPNYFLGCDTTSTCICLTSVNDETLTSESLAAYPNPSSGIINFKFPANSSGGDLEIINVDGKLIYRETISAWSQYKKVDLTEFATGIYFCKLKWGNGMSNIKIIKE